MPTIPYLQSKRQFCVFLFVPLWVLWNTLLRYPLFLINSFIFIGGRQSGAVLYNTFGTIGKASVTERGGVLTSNNSSDSPTGSGYNTDVSEDNLPCDRTSPSSDLNGNSVSDEQVGGFLTIMLWKNSMENDMPNLELISGVYLLVFYILDFA